MKEHECTQEGNISNIKEDISEIKSDIREIKQDLRDHMARTAANEAQVSVLKEFVAKSMDDQQANFKLILESNKDNQAALNRQLKIALGVFAALAALVSALAAWL